MNETEGACNGQCGEHGALMGDVKWVTKLMITGFTLVLSAVVYFNASTQDDMEKVLNLTNEIKVAILTRSSAHELAIKDLENTTDRKYDTLATRLDAIDLFCCGSNIEQSRDEEEL